MAISRFAFLPKTRSLKTQRLLHFSIFFREIVRIKVDLNFALNLLWGFRKKFQKNLNGQILNFFGEISVFDRLIFYEKFFKNPNSKLNAKVSFTLILKIYGKILKKCKSLKVLSECVLR